MKTGYRSVVLLACLLLLLLIGLTAVISAGPWLQDGGVPPVISYQGVLTDGNGEQLTGSFTMTFRLYDTATGMVVLWSEAQPVTATEGLFGVYLGSTSPLSDTLFDGRDLYLGVEVATDGEMAPRSCVPSVPYAFTVGQMVSPPSPLRVAPGGDGGAAGVIARGGGATLRTARSLDVAGMESTSYRIPWSVLATGGMGMASSSYRVDSTLAQPLIGVVQSDLFRISAGYWPGARDLMERTYWVFLPVVLRGW